MTYCEIVQKLGRQFEKNVYYYKNNKRIDIDVDSIESVKPKFNAKLIGTLMKSLEIILKEQIDTDEAIYVEIKASYGNDSAIEKYGPYYLKEQAVYNADDKTYTHTCYDQILKTMIDYQPLEITYPCTVQQYYDKLIQTLGLTSSVSLINGNLIMPGDVYAGIKYTYRDVLDDLATANGTLIYTDEKMIKEVELGTNEVTINDDILKNTNIDFGKHLGPINSIVLSRSANSDNIYIQDQPSIQQNGLQEFVISDNQLMNDNNRDTFLPGLLQKLAGIEFDIFDVELVGYGGFEPLQKVKFETGNNVYYSFVFNNEIEFTDGYQECIYSDDLEETTTDYKSADKTDKRINQAYRIVDKQNGIIEDMISEVDGQNEKISQVLQTVDEINSKISSQMDITISGETMQGMLELNEINQSEPITIRIRPRVENISYLYPHNNLYPSDNLYLKNRILRFENTETKEIFDYILPDDLLYYDTDNYDEFFLSYETQTCQVIKKVGYNADGTTYLLDKSIVKNYDYPIIELTEGNYKISLLGYNTAYLYVTLMAKNIYTSQFATRTELRSSISQTNNKIESEVSQVDYRLNIEVSNLNSKVTQTAGEVSSKVSKIDGGIELASLMRQTEELIYFIANNFGWKSLFSEMTTNGKLNVKDIDIQGGNIELFDSGQGSNPSIIINNTQLSNAKSELSSWALNFINALGYTLSVSPLGTTHRANNSMYTDLSYSHLALVNGSAQTVITAEEITTPKVTQTSLASSKKNFEKFKNALSIIDDIDLYKYNLINEKDIDKKHIGFVIGADFKYSSEITSLDENGNEIGVDIYSMTSLCLQAIKEQQEEINLLKQEIKLLKERIDK